MKEICSTFTSKGRLVIPAELRRKHGIKAGTKVKFLEDQFGRIVLQLPITEEYIDRVMGFLADGPDLLAIWEKEHREEGKHDR
jgi:AbrB family looped-hinge helix DNA binding protein